MAKVILTENTFKKIKKTFNRGEANKVLDLLESLENPRKGKTIGIIGGILIKELKYKKFRFYFITDNYSVKIVTEDELQHLLVKVVDISEKKDQQKVINQIKHILRTLGKKGFD